MAEEPAPTNLKVWAPAAGTIHASTKRHTTCIANFRTIVSTSLEFGLNRWSRTERIAKVEPFGIWKCASFLRVHARNYTRPQKTPSNSSLPEEAAANGAALS